MNMQSPNRNLNHSPDDPGWYLIAEFSLSDFISDCNRSDRLTGGFPLGDVQESGILTEWVINIEVTLARFVKEVREHFSQDERDLPGWVRVFCQQKIIDDATSAQVASQTFHESSPQMNGGWGYYAVEKGRDFNSIPGKESRHIIEIYMYKEGG